MSFFDELGKTISDTGKNVAKKAKDLAGITSLNTQISAEEETVRAQYNEIGRQYFENNKGNDSDPFAEQFKKILDAQAHIAQLKAEIEKIKGAHTCPQCGADVQSGVQFCPSCGAKQEPQAAPVVQAQTDICANCGAQLAEGTMFCPNCGTKV